MAITVEPFPRQCRKLQETITQRTAIPGEPSVTFLNAYFTIIDIIAMIAVLVLVAVAFFRKENVWLGLLAIVVVIWAASGIFGLY